MDAGSTTASWTLAELMQGERFGEEAVGVGEGVGIAVPELVAFTQAHDRGGDDSLWSNSSGSSS